MINEISYVHPVRNFSPAIAGLETLRGRNPSLRAVGSYELEAGVEPERGIISNGIKRKYPILFLLLFLLQFLL